MDRKRSKGRKLGSSRRHLTSNMEDQLDTNPKPEDDPIFNEITEKIKNLLSEEEIASNMFITRNDMEKISGIVFCEVEDLELLFDELNTEGKGYLTHEEFFAGLKNVIGSGNSQWDQKRKRKSTKRISEFPDRQSLEEADAEERKQFKSFMEQLGAKNIFEDETEIWKLWTKLSHEEPRLLENLEEFLAKVTSQIKQARNEKETLEIMLKRRIGEHNEEVQRLYEEMEQQMREEIKKATHERDARSSIHNQEMKNVIEMKNREVQQLVSVQEDLEYQLHKLRSTQQVTKSENEKLKRTNQDLELHLEKIRDQLSEAQGCLSEMKERMIQIETEKEAAGNEASMNIPSAQIFFQDQTQKAQQREPEPEASSLQESESHVLNPSNYTDDIKTSRSRVISIEEDPIAECILKDYKRLEESIQEEQSDHHFHSMSLFSQKGQFFTLEDSAIPESPGDTSSTLAKSPELQLLPQSSAPHFKSPEETRQVEQTGSQLHSSISTKQRTVTGGMSEDIAHHSINHDSLKEIPLRAEDNHTNQEREILKNKDLQHENSRPPQLVCEKPTHVYKIMFVGNAGVGKTSFLQTVHDGSSKPNPSSTVGIDYRIKTMTLDNKQYILQLWDTAGQERFQSITEQFFRKADGMVIMYDVTRRDTFAGARYWLHRIQEKCVDDIVVLLIGNKADQNAERRVTYQEANWWAQEYQLLFSECSAATGENVMESLHEIIGSLKENEEDLRNNVIKLKRPECQMEKERRCCV
ncbi:EF-hand calcium-binding domain-containing protein 4B-like isoform X2 [Hyperolius riggenbachi]|uniref:EF-hand calcium-binding domain-containing protein 4B-like isoform X2 n=1 Tax=Hyperolius riggenbachi TaxID=752182 RepID=UPI0035A27E44